MFWHGWRRPSIEGKVCVLDVSKCIILEYLLLSCYILITNLMHWLLFIHIILYFSTCFEPQVIIFRRIQLYTCSIWYCHCLWLFLVACRYTAWVRTWWTDYYLFIKYYIPLHVSSLKCSSSGGHSCIRAAYGIVTLYDCSWWPVATQLECELDALIIIYS